MNFVGRKKKRDPLEEGEENGLYKDQSLLEYQNKCLCTMLEEERLKVREIQKLNKELENKSIKLSEFTIKISNQINEITKNLSIGLMEEGLDLAIEDNKTKKTKEDIQLGCVEALKLILLHNKNEEETANKIKGIESVENLNEVTNQLIDKLLPLLKEYQKDANKELFPKLKENDLLAINSKLEVKYANQSEKLIEITNEKDQLIIKNEKNKEEIQQLKEILDKNNQEILNLKRKINSHPMMPYIAFEKKYFNKADEEHKCICMICAKEFDSKNTLSNINQQNNNNLSNNFNSNNNSNLNDINNDNNQNNYMNNEDTQLNDVGAQEITKVNEALKKKIESLYLSIDKLRNQQEITEENINNSKIFQSLIAQAEGILTKLDFVRNENNELRRKNFNLTQWKEDEIKQMNQKFLEKEQIWEKKIKESSNILENNKLTIKNLMNKIEQLENLIKAKDSIDFNQMYDLFTNERTQLIKQMESIKSIKKEYLNKYDDEYEKNKTNLNTISKLNMEISDLKRQLKDKNINIDENNKSYDKTNEVILRKKEKINLLKEEVEKLKNELNKERNNNEAFINLNDMNEKGITDLNSLIKNLKHELQETKEKQAKMSNEKLKDNQTILLLKEAKDILTNKNKYLEEQIDNYETYNKKIEIELTEEKRLNKLQNENINLNEDNLEKLRNYSINILKEQEKFKFLYEESQKKINKMEENIAKKNSDHDLLKSKYDDLCKRKKYDPSKINCEELQKENDILKKENDKYRKMVHCKVCKTNIKNVIITKCFHIFCKNCVDSTFESRQRKCPICREPISQNDVKEIYWD